MHPILFQIGSFTIYTYGFFVFLGVILGFWVSLIDAKSKGIDPSVYSDMIFWTIIWSFIGARILYIIVEWNVFLQDPIGIGLSRSGFVFYGGFVAGLLAFYFQALRRKISFLKLADSAIIGLALGYGFGRIGCFFYGCCYGRATNSWIGIVFPYDSPAGFSQQPVIPTQLISSAAMFLIFGFLWLTRKKYSKPGQLLSLYLILESVVRFTVETLRDDSRGQWGVFSTSQWIAFVLFLLGLTIWQKVSKKSS